MGLRVAPYNDPLIVVGPMLVIAVVRGLLVGVGQWQGVVIAGVHITLILTSKSQEFLSPLIPTLVSAGVFIAAIPPTVVQLGVVLGLLARVEPAVHPHRRPLYLWNNPSLRL